MEYNTQRNRLIIPEYGRNIQKMIEHAIKIDNREERNRAALAIVAVMGYLNPQLQNVTDFKHKLWDHLFIIADFKLDVDSPYPVPSRDTFQAKPERISYPTYDIKYKYYGKTMERLIKKISEMEDGEKKDQVTQNVANFMKMSYLTWNKDTVDDSTILSHLDVISKGKMKLKETARLNHTQELLALNKEKERERKQLFEKKKRPKNKKRK
jgi:hypothetical protein